MDDEKGRGNMNLTEVFQQEGKEVKKEIPFPFKTFRGNEIKNEPMVTLVLRNQGKGKVEIEGKADLEFIFPCDRCLTEVTECLHLEFSRCVYAPEMITEEEIREEQLFIHEYEMDLQMLLEEEMQLAWPSKILCNEECKGICKKCGHNLNEGECGCDEFVPDIRFANLMDIFNGK